MLLMRALKPEGQCEPARKSRPPCPPSFLPAAPCAPTTTLTWSPASQGQPHEQPGSASLLPSFLPSCPGTVTHCSAMGRLSEKRVLWRCCPCADVVAGTHTNLDTQATRRGLSPPGHEPAWHVAVRDSVKHKRKRACQDTLLPL